MKSSTPAVSVIIATYNYGRYIGDALRSVQAQTMQSWECIIIDDASTDDTAHVVAEFIASDQRFTYVELQQNVGVSAARNHGLQRAKGEFIQLLDADDLIGPEKLELHVNALQRDPETTVVYSDLYYFTTIDGPRENAGYARDEKLNGSSDQVVARLIHGNVFRLNTVLFRRSVLDSLHGFREEFRYIEDWDFWFRMAAHGAQFRFLDKPEAISGVRRTQGSLSKDRPAMRSYQLPVRQDLWVSAPLSLMNRVMLMIRYCDFLLQMLFVHREPIRINRQGKFPFIFFVAITTALILPFWLLLTIFVRSWRK